MVTWTRGSGQLAQLSCPCGSEASYLLSQVPLLPVRVRNGNTASHSSRREEGIFPTRSQTRGKRNAQPTGRGLGPSGPRSRASPSFRFHFLAPNSFGRGTSHRVPFVLRPLCWCRSGLRAPPDARPKRTAPLGTPAIASFSNSASQ